MRYNTAVDGLLAETRKPQYKPEMLFSTWHKVQILQETQERLEEYREKMPEVDAAVAMPLVLSLLQVRRMQREMDVLTRQVRLLEKAVGRDMLEQTRKDAERLRDQDELAHLAGPFKIKQHHAPKEDKLRDLKVIAAKWEIDVPYDHLDDVTTLRNPRKSVLLAFSPSTSTSDPSTTTTASNNYYYYS